MSKRGGARPGAGRKTKDRERNLIEQLGPYEARAIEVLIEAIERGEAWAIKLFFAYRWGKPRQTSEIEITPASTPAKIYFYDPESDQSS